MLTKEENDRLTRVGPGTPAGELLRRYWIPVVVAKEVTDENPTKFVRVLGEDLVLFKDKAGHMGLLADRQRQWSMSMGQSRSMGSDITILSIFPIIKPGLPQIYLCPLTSIKAKPISRFDIAVSQSFQLASLSIFHTANVLKTNLTINPY